MRRYLAGLALLLVGCGKEAGEPIVLAAAGGWSQSAGVMAKRGVDLARDELNAEANKPKVTIDFVDDSGNGRVAARVAQELVDGVKYAAVIGHLTSGAMKAAAKVYDGHIAAVATAASSPELTGISPWAFRVIASDSVSGIDIARYATRLGKRRAAILYENSAYGRGLADAFRRNFAGEVIGVDPIGDSGDQDFEPYIAWFKSRQPDLVFVAGTDKSGLAFVRAAREQKLGVDLMGGVGWRGVAVDTANAEGVWVGVPFSAEDRRDDVQRFVQAFRARYGVTPDAGAALAYDATRAVAAAARAVGPDRAKIREWLAATGDGTGVPGVTGAIRFGPDGDPVGAPSVMTRVQRGALVVAGR